MLSGIFKYVTAHWVRVRMMMEQFGQATPNSPTIPDEKTRILRARLIMEEAFETIEKGLGVAIRYEDGATMEFGELFFEVMEDGKPNLVEIADGCADLSVVTIGTLVACGLPDNVFLTLVDDNNLQKVKNGRIDEHGKFQKHPDHQPPPVSMFVNDLCMELREE